MSEFKPTVNLRFVERFDGLKYDKAGQPVYYRILQQLWVETETGKQEWRDVPVTDEE